MLRDMVTTSGRVPAMSARSGGQVLKQESRPQRRHSGTAWMVLTKLRVYLGLTIASLPWSSIIMTALPMLCLAVCAPRL